MTTEIQNNGQPAPGAFLDFEKEKVQAITLPQLEKTHKENDICGRPLKGIYHYELIEGVLDSAKAHGYDTEVYDMFAAQNRDRNSPGVVILPQVEAVYGPKAIEAHVLRRVYANIRIKDFDDDTFTTGLAVAFHQRGIQVGFGPQVKICHNQCMLSADKYMATYSDLGQGRGNGFSIEQIMEGVNKWLDEARYSIEADKVTVERMKNIEVDEDRIQKTIGLLTAIRVKCDSRESSIRETATYPLNQAQISKWTESVLVKAACQQGKVSVWDMYDAATQLYKATDMDIPQILPQNLSLKNVLQTEFGF